MVTTGLFIRLEAKPDCADDVAAMLAAGVEHVRKEGLAVAWFGIRLGPTSFAVFDVFETDADRDAHLAANGPTLTNAAAEMFLDAPEIDAVEVVAALVPGE